MTSNQDIAFRCLTNWWQLSNVEIVALQFNRLTFQLDYLHLLEVTHAERSNKWHEKKLVTNVQLTIQNRTSWTLINAMLFWYYSFEESWRNDFVRINYIFSSIIYQHFMTELDVITCVAFLCSNLFLHISLVMEEINDHGHYRNEIDNACAHTFKY